MDKEKYKRSLLKLAKNENHIPGIYNYCDRWCERCTFTNRCLVYAQEKEMDGSEAINDINNEKFWEQLKISFEVTFELLAESAAEMGIDLNNLPEVDIPEHVPGEAEKLSKKYSHEIIKWLENKNEDFREKAVQFLAIEEEKLVNFTDAFEVVQWYSIFISAKVHRAHFNLEEDLRSEDEFAMFDNLGSAKIALIAIDRSMEALTTFYKYMPEAEDEILNFLALLSKIKKIMLLTFPDALAFKRPGFDEI